MMSCDDLFATPLPSQRSQSRGRRSNTPSQSPSRSVKRKKLSLSSQKCKVKEPILFQDQDCGNIKRLETSFCCQESKVPCVPQKRKKDCSSLLNILNIFLLMIVSAFTGILGYVYVDHHYFQETNIIPHSTDLNIQEALRFLSAASQDQIQQLRQELESVRNQISYQEVHSVQSNDCPRSNYEELLAGQDLASAGNLGSVYATPHTNTYTVPFKFQVLGWWIFSFRVPHKPALTTISGLIKDVGDCWAFGGQRGRLVLELHKPSLITRVSISHISASLTITDSILSAPRHFSILAHYSGDDLENGFSLGEFEYKKSGPWRQTFLLHPKIIRDELLKFVEFRFLTNHGHPNYTCVYRVHIHGKVPSTDLT